MSPLPAFVSAEPQYIILMSGECEEGFRVDPHLSGRPRDIRTAASIDAADGSVTDAGNPVSGARIRVLPMELWQRAEAQGVPWTDMTSACDASGLARALAQNNETGADGSFRLRYLAPGYYVVGAPVRDAWAVSQPIEVRAGNETGPVALTAEQTKP